MGNVSTVHREYSKETLQRSVTLSSCMIQQTLIQNLCASRKFLITMQTRKDASNCQVETSIGIEWTALSQNQTSTPPQTCTPEVSPQRSSR